MLLATRDIRRSKLRFGLLAAALGLLVFLLLFLSAISNQLVQGLVGALENSTADVLVVSEDAQGNLTASRLDQATVAATASVPDVGEAVGIGLLPATADVAGSTEDVTLWGLPVGAPGFPDDLIEGRLPESPGEIVVDVEASRVGLGTGGTLTLEPSGASFDVVGVVRDASYFIAPTAYADLADWTAAFTAQFPGSPTVPLNAVGVAGTPGADPKEVAAAIASTVGGVEAMPPADLARMTPGIESITQSFALILGITFVVVVLLVGFFFLILTVQKLRPFTVLRAVGATTGQLGRAVAVQIMITVLAGIAVGTVGLWLVTRASSPEFAISFDASPVVGVAAGLLLSSLAAGWLSVRRIAREDPAGAAFGGTR